MGQKVRGCGRGLKGVVKGKGVLRQIRFGYSEEGNSSDGRSQGDNSLFLPLVLPQPLPLVLRQLLPLALALVLR